MPEAYAVEIGRCVYIQIKTVTVRGKALTLLYSPDGKFMLVNGVFETYKEAPPEFLRAFWKTESLARPRAILEGDIERIRKTCPGAKIIQIQILTVSTGYCPSGTLTLIAPLSCPVLYPMALS